MSNLRTTCSGTVSKTQQTEDFLLSLTVHEAESQIKAHAHDRPYFCLLAQGAYTERGSGTRSIRAGSVLYRRAGYEHSNRFEGQTSKCLNLEVLSPDRLGLVTQTRLPSVELERRGTADIYRLLLSFQSGAPADILNIQCYEAIADHVTSDSGKGDPAWVRQVQERICDDPTGPVSMQAIARDYQMHPNYMIRRFKQGTGQTLSQYLIKKRLDHSMDRLLWGEAGLTDVALDAGFYDQSHYIRNVKKFFGTTPARLRKRLRAPSSIG